MPVRREHPDVGRVRLAAHRRVSPDAAADAPVGRPGPDTRRVPERLGRRSEVDDLVARGVVQEACPTAPA